MVRAGLKAGETEAIIPGEEWPRLGAAKLTQLSLPAEPPREGLIKGATGTSPPPNLSETIVHARLKFKVSISRKLSVSLASLFRGHEARKSLCLSLPMGF